MKNSHNYFALFNIIENALIGYYIHNTFPLQVLSLFDKKHVREKKMHSLAN